MKIDWTKTYYHLNPNKIVNAQTDVNRAVHEINKEKIDLVYLKDCIDNAIKNLNLAFIKKSGGKS